MIKSKMFDQKNQMVIIIIIKNWNYAQKGPLVNKMAKSICSYQIMINVRLFYHFDQNVHYDQIMFKSVSSLWSINDD